MKSYIVILLIALISCSTFLQKQKRIRDINLKSQYSILQEEMNKMINTFLNLFPEIFKSLVYIFDNANFDKIVSDFKVLNKNAETFLKQYSYDNLVEREIKIMKQIDGIKPNSQAIISYIKDNKFPDELAKKIKQMIDQSKDKPDYYTNSGFILYNFQSLIKLLSDKQQYDKTLDNLKMQVKQLPVLIKNMGVPMIKDNLIMYFNQISKSIDQSMPEIIKNLKETFPKIQAIYHNKKKIEEFKLKFRTFFVFKNIASVEDFDIVIKSYKVLIENFFSVFKFESLYQYAISFYSKYLNDMNIFIHGIKDRKYFVEYFINLLEKIFTTYNIKNLVTDFKEAMNTLKNIVKRIEKDGLGIDSLIERLKEKVDKYKEENLFSLCKELLDYFKMMNTK